MIFFEFFWDFGVGVDLSHMIHTDGQTTPTWCGATSYFDSNVVLNDSEKGFQGVWGILARLFPFDVLLCNSILTIIIFFNIYIYILIHI